MPVPTLATSTAADAAQVFATRYETIYTEAQGDASVIPWADGIPNPAMVTWLNFVAPSLIRCGSRVAVVGCGLGEDARELINRGFDVTAFDVSQTAVNWAKELDADNCHCYNRADLFNLPSNWRHRFDLVVEVYTLQSLPPDARKSALSAIKELLGPHGYMLLICRASKEPVNLADGPPWAITQQELMETTCEAGLKQCGSARFKNFH